MGPRNNTCDAVSNAVVAGATVIAQVGAVALTWGFDTVVNAFTSKDAQMKHLHTMECFHSNAGPVPPR